MSSSSFIHKDHGAKGRYLLSKKHQFFDSDNEDDDNDDSNNDENNSDDLEMKSNMVYSPIRNNDRKPLPVDSTIEPSISKKKKIRDWRVWLDYKHIKKNLTIFKFCECSLVLFLLIISVLTFASYVYFKPFDNFMFLSGNNLGVNTSTPQTLIDINGNVSLRQSTSLENVFINGAVLTSTNFTQNVYVTENFTVGNMLVTNFMNAGNGAIIVSGDNNINDIISLPSVLFPYGALFEGAVNLTDGLGVSGGLIVSGGGITIDSIYVGPLGTATANFTAPNLIGNGFFTGTVTAFGFSVPMSSGIETNITSLNSTAALNVVMGLIPVTFFYSNSVLFSGASQDDLYNSEPRVGLDAQSVANATSAYDGIITQTTIPLNAPGTTGTTADGNYTGTAVNYAALVPFTVAAIQQQMKYIQQLALALNVTLVN